MSMVCEMKAISSIRLIEANPRIPSFYKESVGGGVQVWD